MDCECGYYQAIFQDHFCCHIGSGALSVPLFRCKKRRPFSELKGKNCMSSLNK